MARGRGLRLGPRLAGPARSAKGGAHQALLDEPHLSRDDARLLGLRAEAVRRVEAGRRDGLPGRRGLRAGGRQLARAGRLRQPDPQGRDARDHGRLRESRRRAGRERRGPAALQPQPRVRQRGRPLRALPARGAAAGGGEVAEPRPDGERPRDRRRELGCDLRLHRGLAPARRSSAASSARSGRTWACAAATAIRRSCARPSRSRCASSCRTARTTSTSMPATGGSRTRRCSRRSSSRATT